jgi:hypothetical protein
LYWLLPLERVSYSLFVLCSLSATALA